MAEEIQQLILNTLDNHETIQDTRKLVLPGNSDAAVTHDAQTTILGALNSLLSREVRGPYFESGGIFDHIFS